MLISCWSDVRDEGDDGGGTDCRDEFEMETSGGVLDAARSNLFCSFRSLLIRMEVGLAESP